MKKKLIIILCSIFVVLVITGIILGIVLINKNKQNNNNNNNEPVIPPVEKTQLFVPRGVTLTGTILSWDAVENATSYIVNVGDKTYETTECSIDLSGKANERDVLSVIAKANGYNNSAKSIEKIYITLIDNTIVGSMSSKIENYLSKVLDVSVREVER